MNFIDKPVRLWDHASEAVVRDLAGHEARVDSAVFGPDGKTLFSGDVDIV
jgi:WD40 repeat protein